MNVTVRFGTPFRELVGGKSEVAADATGLIDLFENLEKIFPGVSDRLFSGPGKLQDHIHLFVNGEDYRLLGGLNAVLKNGDIVSVLFAVSGG